MSGHLNRLRNGERWWAAEVLLRAGGLILLACSYRTAMAALRLINVRPPHQATLAEFAVCGATFFLLTCGLALTVEGPGLMRQLPVPAHSAFFARPEVRTDNLALDRGALPRANAAR